jgi:hypothetical protein
MQTNHHFLALKAIRQPSNRLWQNPFAVKLGLFKRISISGGHPMKSLIESAAKKAGVPLDVIDLIGRDFISQIIDDLPSLLLPPIMATLKDHYVKKGQAWIEQNALSLQNYFTILRQLYGPIENNDLEKPMYHLVLP